MKILVIGHSSYDISCPVEEYPVENTKYRLTENAMCGGGPAGNAAYLLGKWGIDTYYAGVVGSDDYGTKIKKEFESVGVHTDFLETNYEKPTSISFIMINKKNGSRTLFNIAGERPQMKKYDFNMDPDVILIDGHEFTASMNAINKYPNAITIIDAGRITPELTELCKYCKYVVASKGFAETQTKMKFDFSNPNSLVQIYTQLKNKYSRSEVVITLEDKGALYAVNNEIKIMPGLKVQAVDTTGAGDIFHGAFTYAIAKGYDIEKSVRYANITAGLSVQKLGARFSIPTLVEVTNYYNEKFPGAVASQPTVENPGMQNAMPNVAPINNAPVAQQNVQPMNNNLNETQTPVQTPQINQNVASGYGVSQEQLQQNVSSQVQNTQNNFSQPNFVNYQQAMQSQINNNPNSGNLNV